MGCRRCPTCLVNFPYGSLSNTKTEAGYAYACPACGGKTDTMSNAEPDTDWRERAWDVFYRRHDAERKGPSPDELGKQEARHILELEQRLAQ